MSTSKPVYYYRNDAKEAISLATGKPLRGSLGLNRYCEIPAPSPCAGYKTAAENKEARKAARAMKKSLTLNILPQVEASGRRRRK